MEDLPLWTIDVNHDGSKLLVAAGGYAGRNNHWGSGKVVLAWLFERTPDGYRQLGENITDYGSQAMRVKLSPDGKRFAIGTVAGRVCVYSADEDEKAEKRPGTLLRSNETIVNTMVPSLS